MLKKIILYIIIAIIFFFIGLFIQPRNNSNIDERINKLESVATEINNSQRKLESGIESIGNSISGIRSTVDDLKKRNIESEKRISNIENGSSRIEKGIIRIEQYNINNLETVGRLISGNTTAKGRSEEIKAISIEFGNILNGIEERNEK